MSSRRVVAILLLVVLSVTGSMAMAAVGPVEPWQAPVPEEKEWALAVFINGDNNLDGFAAKDLAELTAAGSTERVHVTVQIDRRGAPADRLYCPAGGGAQMLPLGEVDMGSAEEVERFFEWTVRHYPARHYALVLWNHGHGWERRLAHRGISYDEQSGNHISTVALGELCHRLRNLLGRDLDILAMDACLMQMVEVLYGLDGAVSYVVASEEGVPGDGYPYDAVIEACHTGMTTEAVTTAWVQCYLEYYQDIFAGTRKRATQSAVEMRAFKQLVSHLSDFSRLVQEGDYGDVLKACLDEVVKFLTFGRTNVDLGHLTALLRQRLPEGPLYDCCRAIDKQLDEFVVCSGSAGDTALTAVRGVAVYFPRKPNTYAHEYARLPWCRTTKWNLMIRRFFKQTGWPWFKMPHEQLSRSQQQFRLLFGH